VRAGCRGARACREPPAKPGYLWSCGRLFVAPSELAGRTSLLKLQHSCLRDTVHAVATTCASSRLLLRPGLLRGRQSACVHVPRTTLPPSTTLSCMRVCVSRGGVYRRRVRVFGQSLPDHCRHVVEDDSIPPEQRDFVAFRCVLTEIAILERPHECSRGHGSMRNVSASLMATAFVLACLT
jgi:hypothetical protein